MKKLTLKLDDVSYFLKKDLPTDLINSKSIGMFKWFGISPHFLSIDPTHCDNQEYYTIGKSNINSLKP